MLRRRNRDLARLAGQGAAKAARAAKVARIFSRFMPEDRLRVSNKEGQPSRGFSRGPPRVDTPFPL